MAKVFGYFYFKIDKKGDLTGEYLNNVDKVLAKEDATLVNPGTHVFEGVYEANWREGNNPVKAELRISRQPAGIYYDLEWTKIADYQGKTYIGRGVERNGELTGYYELIP